jgi:hypothetical protein
MGLAKGEPQERTVNPEGVHRPLTVTSAPSGPFYARIKYMKAYETNSIVESHGAIRLVGVPFAPGTEVQVTICPKNGQVGTVDWLLDCPEKNWFQPLPSESTDTLNPPVP